MLLPPVAEKLGRWRYEQNRVAGGLQPLTWPAGGDGIAYNKNTGHLLVTGKHWPHVNEIELVARTR